MRKLFQKVVLFGLLAFLAFDAGADGLVLVNGKELPEASLKGYSVSRSSWKDLDTYVQKNGLLKHPAFLKAYELARSQTQEAFYLVFGESGDSFWVHLHLGNTVYKINVDGIVQNAPEAKPPMNPPVAPAKPVEMPPAAVADVTPTHIWTVGRDATEAERARYKQVYSTDYATFIQHKESNAVIQEQLRSVQQDVQGRNLSDRTFTITWAADKDGIGIKGSESINIDPVPEPPKDPEEEFSAPQLASLEDLLSIVTEPGASEDLLPKFYRWAITADTFECHKAEEIFEFDGESTLRPLFVKLNLHGTADLDSELSVAAQQSVAAWLTRPERLRLFQRAHETSHCLHGVFKPLWEKTVKSRPEFLVWDFYQVVQSIHQNREKLDYNADHFYETEDGGLREQLKLAQELILSVPASQFNARLSQNAKDWLTRDTNSEAEESRKEPIDILKWTLGPSRLASLGENTDVGSVGVGSVASYTIQRMLNPQKYAPQIVLAVSSPAHAEKFGEKHYFIFCAGGDLKTDQRLQENVGKIGEWVPFLDLSESELRELRDRRQEPTFNCGGEGARIGLPVERLKVPLRAPVGEHFVVGSDKKVKAVFTFSLVDQVSDAFVNNMKQGISLQGYQVKSESVVRNPKADFLAEAMEADFYFPTNHATDDSKFWIGSTDGRKFVLEKAQGEVLLQLVVFMPPTTGGRAEFLTDDEISAFFRKRRKISEQRRMTVMNVKCGSASCVPKWQRTYKNSLGDDLTSGEAARLLGEVPLFIGADRTFETGSVGQYMSHAIYPFLAMDMAAQEKPLGTLLTSLRDSSFRPVANIDNPDYFSVEAQLRNVTLVVTTNRGERIVK
ncbi:MAG: hypothetical protein KDD51_03115 [Bdellovibrionales bacterium]|nr:hypothetical protein [Bdellovibrionales bacterium]